MSRRGGWSARVVALSARRSVAPLRRTPVSKSSLCAYPRVLPRLRRISAAFDLIHDHTFGHSQAEQLLLIVIGTAGTGKSFLINAIRYLFDEKNCAESLKVTTPTGIAAANIRGSTVFSLLCLLNWNLSGQRLHRVQMVMRDVKLLIIDEYSFLSIGNIDALDSQLRKIYPEVPEPFGGLNIVLCGDPAQLAPVLAQPVYALRGPKKHLAARFHLFKNVIELDQPFRQVGNDETQKRFRELLKRVANCNGIEED